MDGSPQTHGKQLEVPQAGDRSHQPGAINAQAVTIRAVPPQGITAALCWSSLPDTAWGRKWGSKAPPKLDCARRALGTRGSMGYKQPGEPLRRGANKGISDTASELVPAGRRNRTIPTAHNREQPSPHSLAGKAGDEGEGATSGDSASLLGDNVVGTVAVGTRLGQALNHTRHLLWGLSCPSSTGQSVPGGAGP